jgi:Type II intron maturase
MKKAISFSGQSRFVLEGLKSFQDNLINFNDYDVFIHTWEGPLNKDCYLYEPKSILIEPQKNVVPSNVKESSKEAFTHFSMFYSIKESLRLLNEYEQKNNIKYDSIIRTRFDVSLESKLNIEQFDLREGVYSPNVCGNPAVISDWLNFSVAENIKLYGDIYDNIVNYFKVGVNITSGEELITYMLKNNNILIKKIPCELFLLRDRNIHHQLSGYWKYVQ